MNNPMALVYKQVIIIRRRILLKIKNDNFDDFGLRSAHIQRIMSAKTCYLCRIITCVALNLCRVRIQSGCTS